MLLRNLPLFLLIGFLCLLLPGLRGQGLAGARNLDRAILVHLGYGPYASAGDLATRFGSGWSLDGGAAWLPKNSNLALGFKVQFGFGSQVKEDVLASLRTRDGFLIGNQREPADIQLRQRQLFLGPSLGYTLPIGSNQRAGLQLTSSVGYFFHRIKIQKDPIQSVPQLDEALQAGYDRLTGGPAFYQFIGFQQLAVDRLLNFYLGVEATVGLTRALRNFDYPTGAPPPDDARTDVLLGVKAGLIIPLYFGEGREIFYK